MKNCICCAKGIFFGEMWKKYEMEENVYIWINDEHWKMLLKKFTLFKAWTAVGNNKKKKKILKL